MPKRCVVLNCSNVADKNKNIAIHVIQFYEDDTVGRAGVEAGSN